MNVFIVGLKQYYSDIERLVSFLYEKLPGTEYNILASPDIRNIFTMINYIDKKLDSRGKIWVILCTLEMTEKDIDRFNKMIDQLCLNIKSEIHILMYEHPRTFDQRAMEFLNNAL